MLFSELISTFLKTSFILDELVKVLKNNIIYSHRLVYYYNIDNDLIAVAISTDFKEAYIFDVLGNLESYWINNKGYYTNGQVVEILN